MQRGPRQRFSVRSGSLSVHPPLQARVKHIGNSVCVRQTHTNIHKAAPLPLLCCQKSRDICVSCARKCVEKEHFPRAYLFSSFSFITLSQHEVKNITPPPPQYVRITLWEMIQGVLQNNATYSYSFILVFAPLNLCVYVCTHYLLLHYQGAVMDLI